MSTTHSDLLDERMEKAFAWWRSQGCRVTVVRRIISELALTQEGPFDAESLYRRARETDAQISLSTVYRTLSGLVQGGILTEVQGAGDRKVYFPADLPAIGQSHIVCKDCRRVFPLEDPCLGLREGAVARTQGFHPLQIRLQMEAQCDQIRRTGRCDNMEEEEEEPRG